jgi:DNA end-binding protein Ku
MTADFDPADHKDGYREALAELVEAKVQGRELLQPGTVEIAASAAVSLADALQASLTAAREGPAAGQTVKKGKAAAAKSTPKAIESKPAAAAKRSSPKASPTRRKPPS